MVSTAATALAAATPAAGTPAANAAAKGTLAGNFQTFLTLLMTQLKNQDPTSPLDTNEFTSQLVQFATVEQQINTNASLAQLIALTQSGQVLQSSAMVGKQVEIESDRLALQNGAAALRFTAAAEGPVAIAVYAENGQKLADATVQAAAGANLWTWDGRTGSGGRVRDGAYRVAVTSGTEGASSAVPFTVVGTATGVEQNGAQVKLQVGGLVVDFARVKAVR